MAGKKALLPSACTLLFTLQVLSAFTLGERTSGDLLSEGTVKLRKDGKNTDLKIGILATAISGDGSDVRTVTIQAHELFQPPMLDFQEQSIGMPIMETVQISNPSQSQTLHLNSISGDSPVFHASFFKSKVLKAKESTTFDVIFLPRVAQSVQTSLYIQTSLGTFDYKVQGVGLPNKFRLRSLLGARIPINATYSPVISMYNPFNSSLQITEMYSSGGELHLELLTGQQHGIKSLWEIRPYETKAIGRANFFGRAATNHTSFIRIKTDHETQPSLVLPVEVQVLESASLFLSREILDFGILKSGEFKSLPLYVLNSGSQQVHIKSISIIPENRAVEVEYTSIILKPGSKYTKIALITFHSDRVSMPKQTSGMVVISADGRTSHQLEVPFEVNVLHGSLSYEKSKTLFRVGHPPFHPVVHDIPLANRFKVPVVIYDVKLPSKAQEFFTISSFNGPFVLPPDSSWHYPFSVQFLPSSSECLFNTTLRLTTNSTYFNIPLHCYDGRIVYSIEDVSADEVDTLDYGLLSESDSVSRVFTIHNVNPIEIQIFNVSISRGLLHTTVDLLSIHPTNLPLSTSPLPQLPFFIDIGHSASFRVNVTMPTSKGTHSGEITVETSFDKTLHVPVFYKTAIGGLKVLPEVIEFEPTFPYGMAQAPLFVENLYHQPVSIRSVQRVPEDSRFSFHARATEDGEDYPQLKPKEVVQIGTAVFDPLLETGSESVYLGTSDSDYSHMTTHSVRVVGGAKQYDPSADLNHFSSLWKVWSSLVEESMNVLNFSYVIKPDFGSTVSVPSSATLVWPHLLDTSEDNLIEFPTTTIGSSHHQVVNVTNPSHLPLTVQPVLLHHYTRTQSVVHTLSEHLNSDLLHMDFSHTLSNSFSFPKEHVSFDTDTSLASTVLEPQDPYQITVAFSPKVDSVASTLLLIRNNLTVLDYVLLRGRGIQGTFSIDGVQPSSDPLMFEFTQTMMERCQAGPLLEPMKMSRTFSMYNSGATTLTLYLVGIGAGKKEEGGFAVVNYNKAIVIKPNATKSIEITFIPDFTISRVSNTLRFKTTSGTELLFPLLAILPHNLLAVCYAMQPRPEWEKTLVVLSAPFWICVLVTMIAVVLVQTRLGIGLDFIHRNDKQVPAVQATGGQVFNLQDLVKPSAQERPERTSVDTTAAATKPSSKSVPETLRHRQQQQQCHVESSSPPSRPPPQAPPTLTPLEDTMATHHHHHHYSRAQTTTAPRPEAPPVTAVMSRPVESMSSSSYEHDTLIPPICLSTLEVKEEVTTPQRPSPLSEPLSKQPVSIPAGSNSKSLPESETPLPAPAYYESGKSTAVASVGQECRSSSPTEVDKTPLVIAGEEGDDGSGGVRNLESDGQDTNVTYDSGAQSSENTSPTTGVASYVPPPLPPTSGRKLKGSRRSNSKRQSSSESITVSPPYQAAAPAPVPMVVQATTRDYLERKESESSFKSTDSESTGSSMDKSDDRDSPESVPPPLVKEEQVLEETEAVMPVVVTKILSKPKPQQLPLAKEPNTGQTMHIESCENEPLPVVEEEGRRDGGSSKGKSKRKLRQQKKEEKMKKKEKEREKVSRGSQEAATTPDDEPAPEDSGTTAPLITATGKSGKHRGAERRSKQTKKLTDSGEYDDVHGVQGSGAVEVERKPLLPLPTPPVHSVPSTAIKSSRGLISKAQYEDIYSDPFSRKPDRSTYASKKSNSKKSEKGGGKLAAKGGGSTSVTSKTVMDSEVLLEKDRSDTKSLEGSDGSVGDEADFNSASPEEPSPEFDDVHLRKQQQAAVAASALNPTSPHDLAASLLSKIHKKPRSKSVDSVDYDEEEDSEIAKQDDFKDDDVEGAHEFDLPPTKDSSPPSPSQSPPLPSEQNKTSSLSLDAEPFVPSSNIKPKKHSKSRKHSKNSSGEGRGAAEAKDPRLAEMDPRAAHHHHHHRHGHHVKLMQQQQRGRGLPPPGLQDGGMPVMTGPPEKTLERAEYFHHHSEKHSPPPPPPPPYPPAYGDPQSYRYADPIFDPREDFRRVQERELPPPPPPPPPGMYYDEAVLEQQAQHNAESYMMAKKYHHLSSDGGGNSMAYYQHMHKGGQQMPPGYHQQRPPSYPQDSASFRMLTEEDHLKQKLIKRQQLLRRKKYLLDLYKRELYQQEQVRKSAMPPPTFNQSSRMPPFSHDIATSPHGMPGPSPGSMWDDYMDSMDTMLPSMHQLDDLNDPDVHLSSPYLPASDMSPGQMPSRSRTLSEVSDIGGEILPGYQSGGPQRANSVGPPGYKLAPGAKNSHMEQQQQESLVMMERQRPQQLNWPPESEEWRYSDDNWMLDMLPSPANTRPATTAEHSKDTAAAGGLPEMGLQSAQSPSYVGNTYELFENQSIWSLNNSGSESSNLLSWAMLGAAEHQQQTQPSSDQ